MTNLSHPLFSGYRPHYSPQNFSTWGMLKMQLILHNVAILLERIFVIFAFEKNRFEMEKKLVQQFVLGDEEAFRDLYVKYKPVIHRFIMSFTSDSSLSEDIIQDVFLTVWLNRKNINLEKSFSSYLLTCAKNRIFDFFKKMSRDKEMLERYWNLFDLSRNNTEEDLDALDLQKFIGNAVENLGQRKKEILESRFEGKTHEQIAREFGISKNTVKNHIVESLKYIRSVIPDHGEVALFMLLIFNIFF